MLKKLLMQFAIFILLCSFNEHTRSRFEYSNYKGMIRYNFNKIAKKLLSFEKKILYIV